MEKFRTLNKNEVKEMLENKKGILLDVRTDEEYFDKHIEGSVHIPLGELEERVDELDKSSVYITFCRSGVRSKSAALILLDKGFENVYNSQEGISTWE